MLSIVLITKDIIESMISGFSLKRRQSEDKKDSLGRENMGIYFVLLSIKSGSERRVLKTVKKIEGIKEAYIIFGEYSLIAKIEGKPGHVHDVIIDRIAQISSVVAHVTYEALDEKSE
jgi:DNA-binding Lrp family transcriptional regulator